MARAGPFRDRRAIVSILILHNRSRRFARVRGGLASVHAGLQLPNAESVRKFQPRLAAFRGYPGTKNDLELVATLKGLRRRLGNRNRRRNPFRVAKSFLVGFVPRVAKRNPGLKLANAFSVMSLALTGFSVMSLESTALTVMSLESTYSRPN